MKNLCIFEHQIEKHYAYKKIVLHYFYLFTSSYHSDMQVMVALNDDF